MPRIAHPLRLPLVLAVAALALASCGRRGPLEPPPGSPSLAPLTGVPDQYSIPRNLADLPGENAAGVVVTPAPVPTAPQPAARPPRPFLLDPLL